MRYILLILFSLNLLACGSVSDQPNAGEIGIVLANVYPENPIDVVIIKEGDHVVATSADTDALGTLSFSLTTPSGKAMMSVKNSSDALIKYDLYMVDPSGGLHYTSSCPLMPGLSVYESWPHAIPEIIVTNARILDKSEGYICQ